MYWAAQRSLMQRRVIEVASNIDICTSVHDDVLGLQVLKTMLPGVVFLSMPIRHTLGALPLMKSNILSRMTYSL
ncbi:hypothetical protein D7192_38725 [Burkholderia cepacia]|nr:hypothetical protein [Burkholderia cepacia]